MPPVASPDQPLGVGLQQGAMKWQAELEVWRKTRRW